MSKLKVFIGSSVLGVVYAQCLAEILNESTHFEAKDWERFYDDKGAGTNLKLLFEALDEFDIALFFITKDYGTYNFADVEQVSAENIIIKNKQHYGAKPNVWFEYGLFTAILGEEKSQRVMEEADAKSPALLISDFSGITPYTYSLDEASKNDILKFAQGKLDLDQPIKVGALPWRLKKKLKDSLSKLVKDLEAHRTTSFKAPPNFPVRHLLTRTQCYEVGRTIIEESVNRLYTSLTYDSELNSRMTGYYPKGLWTEIKKKIDGLKANNSIQPNESKKIFKRYLNLANEAIYKQAEEILTSYSDYIEIKDSHCHFIEVVITDDKVLLVLPDSKNLVFKVNTGVYIHSKEVTEQFADWFERIVPEPHKFTIDSVDKLMAYREFTWEQPFKRNQTMRCLACTMDVSLPPEVKDALAKLDLFPSR